ncbi:HepT-like ribonuclease domain-containing protein [Pelobium manganitolerans]|uniref:HepT-like ribonuclease domain-containing protein n=1 Tax=Pelobium manganitolerans TaxID=1842495 RepID=UPI003FA3DB81
MDEKVLKWLFDVKIAIDEIDAFFVDQDYNFLNYQRNIMLKRAVERNLEVIGEAINRIVKYEPVYKEKIANYRSIISLRNQVIHAYDNISDENIWSILIKHLPMLKTEVQQLLDNTENGELPFKS